MLDTNIFEKPKDYITVGGETMTVDTPDATTVVFNLLHQNLAFLRTLQRILLKAFSQNIFLASFTQI